MSTQDFELHSSAPLAVDQNPYAPPKLAIKLIPEHLFLLCTSIDAHVAHMCL
jgi:hypothetical protein